LAAHDRHLNLLLSGLAMLTLELNLVKTLSGLLGQLFLSGFDLLG
jgi:hypothetical protein